MDGRGDLKTSWKAEYEALLSRDQRTTLGPADLERLGIAAYLAGDQSGSVDAHTRAHNTALERGDTRQAARSAFWVAFAFIGARELPRAAGWAARARRLLEEDRLDCAECGYVMLPAAIELAASGDLVGADAAFAAAERIGERFADPDLTNLARQGRGRALVGLGRVAEGVSLFDEVMVAVTAGEMTPIMSGIVYCNVISACFEILDMRRAQEWTEALTDFCGAQPDLVPFRGECLTNRAEIFRLRGRWPEALDEAGRAFDGLVAPGGWDRVPPRTRWQSSTASGEKHPRRKMRTGWPVSTAGRHTQAWRCCASRRGRPTPHAPRSIACWPNPRAGGSAPRF